MSRELIIVLDGLAATERLGQTLGESLEAGLVLALVGTLGAGKTTLARAIAAGCGVDPTAVTSPTFVLCQSHQGRLNIHHADVYRLADSDEFLNLGPEEWWSGEDAVTLVEWADRVADCLPEDRLVLSLEVLDASTRRLTLTALGPQAEDWLRRFQIPQLQ